MGIVNVTPNSFSDGGEFFDSEAATACGRELAAAGARILDVGAEASSFFREGVRPVNADEQIRRLENVIPALAAIPGVMVSVDTRSAAVARWAAPAGAMIVNDISGGTHDSSTLPAVAEFGMGIVLMHTGENYPATPHADDPDILKAVADYLRQRIAAAIAAGIPRECIAVDPGVGFGKTMADNWRLALRCHELTSLGTPVVLGASRKRSLETAPPPSVISEENWRDAVSPIQTRDCTPKHARDPASAAVTMLAARNGVAIHRVHDVTLSAAALRLAGLAS